MGGVIAIVFISVAAAQFLGTIVYLVNTGLLWRRLETRYKAVHESIWSPLLIANNTPRNNGLFIRWLWNREFETLGDSASVALAGRVRSLYVWLMSGFVAMLALFALLAITR